MTRLRERLASPAPALGLWVTLESASLSEIASVVGLDWIVVDAEHGHLDYADILAHVRATTRSDTTPLVRVPGIEAGVIKRVLDIGAMGIIVPMVDSADDVRRAISLAKYPPDGVRGLGAERATRWGRGLQRYATRANADTLVLAVIETAQAADAFEEIISVEGLDGVFFGPLDLAASMGVLGQWGSSAAWERIADMREVAKSRGMPVGIVATGPEDARVRCDEGFDLVAVGFDTHMFVGAIERVLETVGRTISEDAWDE